MGGLPGGGEAAAAASEAAIASLAAADGPTSLSQSGNTAVARLRDEMGGQPGTTLTVAAVLDGPRSSATPVTAAPTWCAMASPRC